MTHTVTVILSALTVLAQILSVILLLSLIGKGGKSNPIVGWFGRNGLLFGFIISMIAMLGSLFYSEIASYTPCEMCWYQRILMYPQTLLFLIAMVKKDHGITKYILWLCGLGALVAAYHYLLQLGLAPAPCSAVGISTSCSQRFVLQFGYITIPMMAFSAFLFIFMTTLAHRRVSTRTSFDLPDGR